MHTLALNAAEGLLQAALLRPDGGLAVFAQQEAPSRGAELLAPMLRDLFAEAGLTPKAAERIAAVRGPGSFTGLRLVLATAAGLARATGAELAGLDYLPLLAASAAMRLEARGEAGADRFWALTHARRNLVHVQGFGPAGEAISGIAVLAPGDCLEAVASDAADGGAARAVLFGSGLSRNREAVEAALKARVWPGGAPRLLPADFDHPLPDALARAASKATYGRVDITPLYVRPPDAEDNLERIAASLGLDPGAARRRLAELTGQNA